MCAGEWFSAREPPSSVQVSMSGGDLLMGINEMGKAAQGLNKLAAGRSDQSATAHAPPELS